ncbi:MAG: alcohol dehydrogenase catalytic domain-containing protein [Anaerolineales bacterium]|nr:alcohol dehydrogenase catalytic domain-containing protein [Anaerolineales bacterium]MCX7754281.1 alcohol dehydrogenase catalytic domain-containing protein [Anaerolineales bacterium]MDW8278684.1 alcohol dehydrogenase catalytic domain-containing protein [Anaerolineales bacterium]
MKALWLEHRQLRLRDDVPMPARRGEALIRVRLAGVCGTDLEMVKGYYPFTGVLGHEFVGEVVQIDDACSDWLGKRVVGEINAVCGQCEQCRNGRPTHCENRTVLGILNRDGVFAEYVSLPPDNLHRVPDSVPDEAAVFTEPLAAALEIQQQVQIRPTDRVLLVGAGRLGQLIAQTLALTGAGVQVVARHSHQQELLRARGISVLNEADVASRRYDVVVEATGSPEGFALARKAIRPRGTFVLKSTYKGEISLNLSPLVVDEITIVGSRCGPFAPALRLLEKREIDPTPLIAAEFGLNDGIRAFQEAEKRGVLKVLLRNA